MPDPSSPFGANGAPVAAPLPGTPLQVADCLGRRLHLGDIVQGNNTILPFVVLADTPILEVMPNLPPGARKLTIRAEITFIYQPGGAMTQLLRIGTATDPEQQREQRGMQ